MSLTSVLKYQRILKFQGGYTFRFGCNNALRNSSSTVELDEDASYKQGKEKLGELMGVELSSFSEKDVEHAIRYLLPTSLSAKDARPFLKHPSKVFPSRTGSSFEKEYSVPLDPAFYTGSPSFYRVMGSIYQHLARVCSSMNESTTANRVWVKKDTMTNILAEDLTDHQYNELIQKLNHLVKWENCPIVKEFLEAYHQPQLTTLKHSTVGEQKIMEGLVSVGRRKASTSVVKVKEGVGNVCVNGRPLREYFPRPEHREQVLYPLIVTGTLDELEITATVKGGGMTGQAGAIRLGISKALLHYGNHSNILGGLVVRDSRSVERKKPGQKKARKKFAWVKR